MSISLSDKQAEDLYWDETDSDFPEYSTVEHEIIDHGRWTVTYRKVVKFEDGTFYQVTFDQAATESQDHDGVMDHGPVKAVEKTVTVYE